MRRYADVAMMMLVVMVVTVVMMLIKVVGLMVDGDGDGGGEFSKWVAWSSVEFSRGFRVGSFYSLSGAELTTLDSRVDHEAPL